MRPSAVAAILLGLALALPAAADPGDYSLDRDSWNGLSGLRGVMDAERIAWAAPERLDVGTLQPGDGLLIVAPTSELPVGALSEFMRAGGRVALLDDYGTGDQLLAQYRMVRGPADTREAAKLRGNDNLPAAERRNPQHPLADGVPILVTNHPTELHHAELDPVFAFRDGRHGVVLAGAVGAGRLVTVSDPSIVINNMLKLSGNHRFARNLVRYLSQDGGGRLLVLGPGAELVGRFGEPGADRPLHDLRAWLEELASAETPPLALTLAALTLAAILVVIASTALPRRSPYTHEQMFAVLPQSGGFVGRVEFFARRSRDLLHPLMVYKFEFEGAIVRALNVPGGTLLRDLVSVLRRRGFTEQDVGSVRALLLELDDLRERQDRPPHPPRIGAARFARLVARGESLLGKLEEQDRRR